MPSLGLIFRTLLFARNRPSNFLQPLRLPHKNLHTSRSRYTPFGTQLGMMRNGLGHHPQNRSNSSSQLEKKNIINASPGVDKIQQLVQSDSTSGWEKCWEVGATPWDLGQPTPILLHLHRTGALPKGRALIPGCGRGHDVVAIACPERYVIGLDISDIAIKKAMEERNLRIFQHRSKDAKEVMQETYMSIQNRVVTLTRFGRSMGKWGVGMKWGIDEKLREKMLYWEFDVCMSGQLSSTSAYADYLTFLMMDFFTWHPNELFDLVFDYTFFCAIEPDMRSAWASRIQDLLKPDGELITLMFPISDHVGGPPYKVSIADYEEVLNPIGFKAISIVENELAVGPRKGREKLGRWKRSIGQSLL